MKKTKLINSMVSSLISDLGHTDRICISDAGLPVSINTTKIDLAIKLGLPRFKDVLKVINTEAKFEKAIIAREVMEHFPNFINMVQQILDKNCKIEMVDHKQFKKMVSGTKAVIRTGENKWFHNIILQSGVTF